jgi:hypothetical protein
MIRLIHVLKCPLRREAQYADMGMKDRVVSGAKSMAYNHPKASCLVFLVIILLSVHFVSSHPLARSLARNPPPPFAWHAARCGWKKRSSAPASRRSARPQHFGHPHANGFAAPQVAEILPSLLLYFVIIPGDMSARSSGVFRPTVTGKTSFSRMRANGELAQGAIESPRRRRQPPPSSAQLSIMLAPPATEAAATEAGLQSRAASTSSSCVQLDAAFLACCCSLLL